MDLQKEKAQAAFWGGGQGAGMGMGMGQTMQAKPPAATGGTSGGAFDDLLG
jgi:hypothetical protein